MKKIAFALLLGVFLTGCSQKEVIQAPAQPIIVPPQNNIIVAPPAPRPQRPCPPPCPPQRPGGIHIDINSRPPQHRPGNIHIDVNGNRCR
jgi:hypothetical protein